MWLVLQTAPNRERQVAQLLEDQHVSLYVPQFPVGLRTRPGSVRDRQARSVFPGYVFFRFGSEASSWRAVANLAGVRRVLLEDGKPGAIADSVIEHLQRRLHDGLLSPPSRRFLPGQPVVIEHGPLAAVDAIFDCDLDKRARVQVLVELMGRPLQVQIDANQIRSVAS